MWHIRFQQKNLQKQIKSIIFAIQAKYFNLNALIMARPIKETPILYGEEARKFEMRMMNPIPVSREQMENMKRDYEFMSSRCVNCSF